MKIRKNFVTNSSSASFIIERSKISEDQLDALLDHLNYAKNKLGWEVDKFLDFEWNIKVDNYYVKGFVIIDNFPMDDFMENIGIDLNNVSWDRE